MNRPASEVLMAGRHVRGFTLLEVLVAIAIFAIAATLAFGGLRHIIDAQAQLLPRQTEQSAVRYAVTMLSQDLMAAAPRAVRDPLGTPEPAVFAGQRDELVSFTRRDTARAVLTDTVGVYRVRYRLEDGQLLRDVWPVLDTVQSTLPTTQVLLTDLDGVKFRFLDGDPAGGWRDLWPAGDVAAERDRVPRAIEFELLFADGRTLRRLLLPSAGT